MWKEIQMYIMQGLLIILDGWRDAYTTAAAVAAGTKEAEVSVPGIKFLQRFSCCSVCFTIYQVAGNIQSMLNETVRNPIVARLCKRFAINLKSHITFKAYE